MLMPSQDAPASRMVAATVIGWNPTNMPHSRGNILPWFALARDPAAHVHHPIQPIARAGNYQFDPAVNQVAPGWPHSNPEGGLWWLLPDTLKGTLSKDGNRKS